MRRILPLLTALLALTLAPTAQAVWYAAEPVDGPGEIDALGDVDLARDGDGGVVYLKRAGGVPQVFLARMTDGAWQPPEQLSAGAPASEAVVSATDGGRLAIAYIAGGNVFATVVPAAGQAPAAPVQIGGGDATGLAIDMGINEAAYAVWSQPGSAGDVRAARLDVTAWTPLAAPLDVDPSRSAGTTTSRPRVAVSAEGNAVVTWGEDGADGRNHVYARRLTAMTPSIAPQDLTLADFEGQGAGSADSPDIDIEDDGSFAWVAFRQDVGGRSRSIARRLLGSQFEAPAPLDGGQTSGAPRIDFAGKGIGGAVAAAADNAVFSGYLDKFDAFQPAVRLDATAGAVAPGPVVATSERGDVYAAWRIGGADGSGSVNARRKDGEGAFEPEFQASNPLFGPVPPGQVAIGADRSGNVVVAMLQGGEGGRQLTAAVYDRLPGVPVVLKAVRYRSRRPTLKWQAGSENWGTQTFTLLIDGKPAGQTTGTRLVSTRRLRKGTHRYQVTTVDRRGQTSASRVRTFRVDAGLPTLRLRAGRPRRVGKAVRIRITAGDRGPAGLDYVELDFGDGSRKTRRRSVAHRYKKAGRYTVVARAVDKAGNVTVKRLTLRIVK